MKDMCTALAVMFTLLDSSSIFVQQLDGEEITVFSARRLLHFEVVTIVHKNFADLLNK